MGHEHILFRAPRCCCYFPRGKLPMSIDVAHSGPQLPVSNPLNQFPRHRSCSGLDRQPAGSALLSHMEVCRHEASMQRPSPRYYDCFAVILCRLFVYHYAILTKRLEIVSLPRQKSVIENQHFNAWSMTRSLLYLDSQVQPLRGFLSGFQFILDLLRLWNCWVSLRQQNHVKKQTKSFEKIRATTNEKNPI